MSFNLSLPFPLHLPPPSAAQAVALLDVLNDGDVTADAVIETALVTPSLIVALLWMTPLKAGEDTLRTAMTQRLSTAGAPLIRAWVLQAGGHLSDNDFASANAARSLHLSSLTTALASASGMYEHMAAQLAGLWMGAGELSLAASIPNYVQMLEGSDSIDARFDMEQEHLGTDHLQVASRLADACGLGVDIQDALLMSRLNPARLEGAHPLSRLLHTATQLTRTPADIDAIARFSGIAAATLSDLRERYSSSVSTDLIHSAHSVYPMVPSAWRTTVLASLTADIFGSLADHIDNSLTRAFRLLFCAPAPLLLKEESGRLIPFATGTDPGAQTLARRLRELELNVDDASSVVSLAVRSQAITTQYVGRDAPSRNTKDWHVARWLGHRSLTCLPFDIGGQRGVGVVGERDDPAGITAEQRLMAQLVQQAARSHFRDALYRHQVDAHGEQIREDIMAHVRRIKHEASGPLTVLQAQLSLLAEQDDDSDSPVSLHEISHEVARVNELLSELVTPPTTVASSTEASINAEVGRLRELYGHALFEQRGRHLDVRLPPSLPPVAITPKALTQVLLNLVRNAAEALPESGTLSIRSSGVAITGGRPCVEILLKDDGPGLPLERQKALFEAAPSTKGEDHQGIGLSIVKQLLDEHGAYIFCRTIKNQGTSFQIYIPVVDC
ncbi:ATP-binding protein [Nitrogeniibacter aestuarii]|uniref:ATP-binding protein n=1 Tax=Nitrogeniibacter aestuarii TaxID=2815343 RepID=UPI001E2AF633|nr:ATP-binding protein [Nitrogeniibacter aestuarii]